MPTISEQLTQLVSDRDDLVSNLTTKGITGLTGNETFTELVPEVLNIPSGGGGIDWSQIGYSGTPQSVQDGYDYAKQIYDNWDSSQTNLANKFLNDKNLVLMPLVNISQATSMSSTFEYCYRLIYIPILNTSNVANFFKTFYSCYALKLIPQIDTSNCTSSFAMFADCKSIETIPQLNMGKNINVDSTLQNCWELKNFGGFLNLGQAYLTTQSANFSNYTLKLTSCTLLTHDSLMNVINGLYDIATKGCNAQKLTLGSTNLAKLTAEEISTCTSKGWSVS